MLQIDFEFTKCSYKNSEKHMRDTFAAASLWSFNLTFNMQKISTVSLLYAATALPQLKNNNFMHSM